MAALSLDQHDVSPRIRLRRWRFAERYDSGAAAHPGIEVAWCRHGAAEYRIGTRRVVLCPGQAIIVPAQVEHVTVPEAGTEAASLLLDERALEASAEAMGSRLEGARLLSGDERRPSPLMVLGGLLEREAAAPLRGGALAVEALTDALVVEVLRAGVPTGAHDPAPAPGGGVDPRVRRAIDLVEARYADPLGIDDLARAAHMSRYHFSRVFRAETGKTPYRYLLDVRLARAAQLLRSRRCDVTEAALSVGWNDLGRFGRMFRQAHGVAPSAYLRASAGSAGQV
jgi:AraC family transcriptional regulator